jgi:Outer membrane protein beta-barrel domain
MNTTFRLGIVLAALLPAATYAQQWELGVLAGGSFYTSQTVRSANASANAGFSKGPIVSVLLGHTPYKYVGGEFHYSYLQNDLELSSGGTKATFGAQAHMLHYDFLFYTTSRESRVRPFFAAGAGLKIYRGTGQEVAAQPLSNVALLTRTRNAEALVSLGAGIKCELAPHINLRAEFRDFLTPFPAGVIAPANNARVSGWIHDFTPMAGITFSF